VVGIDTPDGPLDLAVAGQSVILRLAEDIDVSRGDLIASVEAPPAPVREIAATVSWLADRELEAGARVLVQHGTSLTKGLIRSVDATLDLGGNGQHPVWVDSDSLALNDLARIKIAFASPLPLDFYNEYRGTGAFILVDAADGWTLGAGMAGPPAFTVEHRRAPDEFDEFDTPDSTPTPDSAGQIT
jgi:sulfate adenylyltransferase subunit 1